MLPVFFTFRDAGLRDELCSNEYRHKKMLVSRPYFLRRLYLRALLMRTTYTVSASILLVFMGLPFCAVNSFPEGRAGRDEEESRGQPEAHAGHLTRGCPTLTTSCRTVRRNRDATTYGRWAVSYYHTVRRCIHAEQWYHIVLLGIN